jgi:hypothetical protein
MQRYLIDIWVGSGEQRWNTQSITVMARSLDEARGIIAESLYLTPAHWQGDNPPLELVGVLTSQAQEEPDRFRLPRLASREVRRATGAKTIETLATVVA